MVANELMIGDWVMVNDIEHTHPLQVTEIFNKCGAYYATLYWDGMPDNVNPEVLTADVDKVLPIPLTPEILEKNGFRIIFEGDLHVSYFQDIGRFHVEIKVDKVGIFQKLSMCDGFWNKITIIECRFVHQLQHALRLCGIEKEIEL